MCSTYLAPLAYLASFFETDIPLDPCNGCQMLVEGGGREKHMPLAKCSRSTPRAWQLP